MKWPEFLCLFEFFLKLRFSYEPPPVADGGTRVDVEEVSTRLFDNGDICSLSGEGVVLWWCWEKYPFDIGRYGGGLYGCCLMLDAVALDSVVDPRSKSFCMFPDDDIVNIANYWALSFVWCKKKGKDNTI